MKFTFDWLKDHLKTNQNESKLIEQLTHIGLEVESVANLSNGLELFKVAKILKTEKHPNADRLKVCEVDIGDKESKKVVCGAKNARTGLLTIYAPPGAVIPKSNLKLEIAKIRGVTSYGMLCSGAELNLSNDSEGITELSNSVYQSKVGKSYFPAAGSNIIDLSITPNRPDCLGIRGIARDLAASGFGKLKKTNLKKIKFRNNKNVSIKLSKEKNQSCSIFGSCLVSNVKNVKSPEWLKQKLISIGQKPISAIVDITNYMMFDLNRPLHVFDVDKIEKNITVRNSKPGEKFDALDNKTYRLDKDMCVISDKKGVLALGGIMGGLRSSTQMGTKNVLIESAYFDPTTTRITAKKLGIDSDAKFRFERGIDPLSVHEGLIKAANLIQEICGGEINKIKINRIKSHKKKIIQFDQKLFEKVMGIKISNNEVLKILHNLGFDIKKNKKTFRLSVPSWRPDISQAIDVVEEIARIKGYDKIKTIEPKKLRSKPTLNQSQKLFHFLQRAIASKGYSEAITWSFTDSFYNDLFRGENKEVKIVNPISSDLSVLRSSILSNLIFYIKKNLNRDIKDLSLFEIGPVFNGSNPGDQEIVVGGFRSGKVSRLSWIDKERDVDIFDVKKDIIQTLEEAGYDRTKVFIDDKTPNYYHPGKSGRIFLNKEKDKVAAFFGEIHPNILNKISIKTEALIGFEIFIDNLKKPKKSLKDRKTTYKVSDFQKSERDFAFIIDKNFKSQELIEIISNVDRELISSVEIFDIYEGHNIPENKKSIALNITIQSLSKPLEDKDLENLNKSIITIVEKKTGAKIRS